MSASSQEDPSCANRDFTGKSMIDSIIRKDVEKIRDDLKKGYFKGKRVLVTGGAGFIGSWICDVLVGLGSEVVCLDNFSTGKKENIDHLSGEAAFKLCRIEDKTVVKGGNVHLDLNDGSSYLIKLSNPQNPEEDIYHTLDVLKLGVPDRELLGHTKLTVGAPAIVIGGKNMGKYGKVITIEKKPSSKRRDLLVTIKDVNGDQFQTILDFVFILGDAEPSVSLPEAD